MDFEVLRSLDLDKYKPTWIMVEDDVMQVENLNLNKFVKYLREYGYELKAAVLDNLYFSTIH